LQNPAQGILLSVVTGGAGFLGGYLVDALFARGGEVVIVDDLSSGPLHNVDEALQSGQVAFVYSDSARSAGELREPLVKAVGRKRIERIFHFSPPASLAAYDARPWETLNVNSAGTMALIDLALEQRCPLIVASTSFAQPTKIVRFFNCYGPRISTTDGRLIGALSEALLADLPLPIQGDGLQTRGMTFVDDAIAMFLVVAERPQPELTPINVGSDPEHAVLEIVKIFARVAGVPFVVEQLTRRPGDPRCCRPKSSRARSLSCVPERRSTTVG
jgi:nucleoside-diphosphate-sugar epimerase